MRRFLKEISMISIVSAFALAIVSCARMGNPDGGWYDETPPRVIATTPKDGGTGVDSKRVSIYFDEFVKIDNPTENVIVSPPQLEMPDIKSAGKKIVVNLKDSLKANTTYTIDFSDAISDNNEGNPLGNYTYSFSTGDHIDTMEVSGNVVSADNLEPVQGILVGLYSNLADSAFTKTPLLRVARTDSRGHFIIRGIAPGSYHVYALQDQDGNYMYSQKAEMMAFDKTVITPSVFDDIRQDTIWKDSLHIADIKRVGYKHYMPDNICLRAFTQKLTDRYFIKTERKEADNFSLYFSYGSNQLPVIKGLNFDATNAFITEPTQMGDTITYWLKDTTLVNQDTLNIELNYLMTDSLGNLVSHTDTLDILSKQPYKRRMKEMQDKYEKWKKKQEKAKKREEAYDTIMPRETIEMKIDAPSQIAPDRNILISFPKPLASVDTSKIHLYSEHDSLWYIAPFEIVERRDTGEVNQFPMLDSVKRNFILRAAWRPNIEYSLEIDSAAFVDIYGIANAETKNGFKVHSLDDYSTIIVTLQGMEGKQCVVQLLNSTDTPVKEVKTSDGTAEFFYVDPDEYYMRMYVDENGNGKWDTGNYADGLQPEEVYYYPESIKCRAKWDVAKTWNPTALPLDRQKPAKIKKQKTEKKKQVIKNRNAERARKMGLTYIPGQMN